MNLQTQRPAIRDFTRADAGGLHRIAREENIPRFMADWIEGTACPRDCFKISPVSYLLFFFLSPVSCLYF